MHIVKEKSLEHLLKMVSYCSRGERLNSTVNIAKAAGGVEQRAEGGD